MCPKINRVQPSNNHPRALEEQSNNNTSSTQSQNVLSCNESLNEVELPKLRVAERDLGKIYTSLKPQIKECEELDEEEYNIYLYDEDEVVERANSESGTTLWTNHGQVFINHPGNDHAEILFISNNNYPRESITTLHIKNSPCYDCATALIKYFKHCPRKPTIYVGRIWHLDKSRDDNGLKDMMSQGFQLKVWDKLHDRMYPRNITTADYLKKLKK